MSKYNALWEYVQKNGSQSFKLTFEEIQNIAGISIDHSFLKYKKELTEYGYQVGKISMKESTVIFNKLDCPNVSGGTCDIKRKAGEFAAGQTQSAAQLYGDIKISGCACDLQSTRKFAAGQTQSAAQLYGDIKISSRAYYHMTALNHLNSIAAQGLIPKNENNGKLIGEEKVKVFFSEGFEGAIALFVDFDVVFNKIKKGQIKVTDESVKKQLLNSESLSDYLGEGVYLQFDGTGIKNERNFENGCTDRAISPEKLSVCILRKKSDNSIIFSRFAMIKYMMAQIHPEQIKYYGASYEGSPAVAEATNRIQEKVKKYYQDHQTEISKYNHWDYILDFIPLKDFVDQFLNP